MSTSGFIPDYMHFGHLGIASQFAKYWFDSKISPLSRTLNHLDIKAIDKYLGNIQVPNQAMRSTRSISYRRHWKAKECQTWTLLQFTNSRNFFLVKILVRHWELFVEAVHMKSGHSKGRNPQFFKNRFLGETNS